MIDRGQSETRDDKSRKARRRLENVDVLCGFLCFGVVFLVGTIVTRVLNADPAVTPALLLFVLLLVVWALLKFRKRLAAAVHPQKIGEQP